MEGFGGTQDSEGDCVKVTNFSVSETFDEQHKPIPAIANKYETSAVEVDFISICV
jgi:hypothetical protein